MIDVLRKGIKRRRESIEMYAGKREDLAEKERAEVAILETYLPASVSEDELRAAVRAAIAGGAAQIGAVLSGAGAAIEEAAAEYGRRIGTAFQIIDDLLDYTSTADQMGKNAGDDLREGKPTLPLIHLLSNGTEEQRALVRQAIEQGGTEHFDAIFAAIQASGALEYTRQAAEREAAAAEAAANALPPSLFRQTLIDLCAFSLQRQS